MAEITEKIIEIKAKVEGETTVKELKEQVAELSSLMNTLDKESVEYKDTVNLLVDAEEKLTNVMKVGKSQLSAQEGSYNALVNRMAALKKAHKAVTDETTRNRLSEEINNINNQLKEMDANNGVYVRNVGNYENAFKEALKTPQQELKALRTELAQLTEGTDEYNAVFTRMAQLTHDVKEQQEQLKWSSADLGDILGNVSGVATSLAGGFSAFNALSGLMGGESEELEKAMLQAQRFIQLIQGLEQFEELGDKIKGLWKGVDGYISNLFNSTKDSLDSVQETVNDYTSSIENINDSISNSVDDFDNYSSSIDNVNESLDSVQNGIEGMNDVLENHVSDISKSKDSIDDYASSVAASKDSIDSIQDALDDNVNMQTASTVSTKKNTSATIANTSANAINTASVNKDTSATVTNTTATQTNTTATNAQSAANVVATTTTGLFSKALGVLRVALISTGIGAIVVALGALVALLGKGIGSLWNWVTGTTKAKEQTENLQNSFNALNESLDAQEKSWERQERMMKAQGKSYDEIYQARKKNLQTQLVEVQALLASQQAIAKDIGQRKLQKEKYDEFRKTLEELTEKERQLKQAIDDLDFDNQINDTENETKAEQERIKAKEDAAKAAVEAHKKEKESADKLYKDLQEHYKDEQTKLKEKYEEEKKLLEKFGKDTTLLTKKYEEDKTAIVLKEEEARKKLIEQYNKNLDDSFRYPSIEYFDNHLSNATEKLEHFQMVASTIKIDEQGFKSAENWSDNIKELTDTYGVSIQSFEDFENVLKRVLIDYENAKKELEDYEYQSATDDIDKRIGKLNDLTELEITHKQQEYELYASSESYFGSFTNNYISQMHLRWKTEDDMFQLRKERLEQEIKMFKEAASKEGISESTRLKLLEDASKLEKQLALETTDYTIAQNQRKAEASDNYVKSVQDSMKGVGDILDNVASAWETSIQAELDSGKISQEQADEKFEDVKKIQSAQALINTFSSAVSAYQSMASIPLVGPALGAAAAAAAIASGLEQVKAINAVKKGDTSGGGSDSTRYSEVTPKVPNDYNPQAVTNVTGGQETENLANVLTNTSIWVSVRDIDSVQSRVKTRDKETSF